MLNGGYKIIDFLNKDIYTEENDTVTIKGIYESIESNYKKALLLSGLFINGVEKNDTFSTLEIDGTNFIFHAYGYKITITDDDEVTAVTDTAGNQTTAYKRYDISMDDMTNTYKINGVSATDDGWTDAWSNFVKDWKEYTNGIKREFCFVVLRSSLAYPTYMYNTLSTSQYAISGTPDEITLYYGMPEWSSTVLGISAGGFTLKNDGTFEIATAPQTNSVKRKVSK